MKVAITGGGISGLTTAIALQQVGISTVIYEAASQIKPLGAGLVLAANAMKALSKLDLAEALLAKGRLLDAFSILDAQGKVIIKTDSLAVRSKYGADNFAIHRADLHQVLLSYIPSQNLRLNKQCVRFEQKDAKITLYFSDGSLEEADYLLACDGIHSPVRNILLPDVAPRYAGHTCWRAVLDFPNLPQNEASETWSTLGRFGIVPLASNNVYYFACLSSPPGNPFLKNYTPTDLIRHFENFHKPIPQILHQTQKQQLLHNDIYDIKPLSRYAFGNILLLGDAAHATTPNMGQGACQAIEDAVVLASEWKKAARVEEAFLTFEKRRLARTHYITTQSWRIGQMAHLSNNFLATIRNSFLRMLPARVKERNLKKLLDVEF